MNVFNLEHTSVLTGSNILKNKRTFPMWAYPYV